MFNSKNRVLPFVMVLLVLCILATGCGKQSVSSEISDCVIGQFEKIAEIPRPSGHEEKICNYLEKWAKERNFDLVRDDYNNLVIDVPATDGMENKPIVGLQCHMDMVFVQEGDSLDPLTTGVRVINDGEFIRGDGTSLGSDDGIGLSVILCIADGKMAHGPLRLFITTDEEETCSGADNLDPAAYSDIRYFINVDWETEGNVCISSVAGVDYEYSREGIPQKAKEDIAIEITIDKLAGGHSGIEIIYNRLNAIVAMGETLKALEEQNIDFSLSSLTGGTADNVIPYSSQAVICTAKNDSDKSMDVMSDTLDDLLNKHRESDPDGVYSLKMAEIPEYVMSDEMKDSAIDLICEIPDGIRTYSAEIEGFPQTSSNLGVFEANSDHVYALTFARSSNVDDMESICRDFEKVGDDVDADYVSSVTGKAWEYDTNSKLLKTAQSVYKSLFNKEIVLEPTHVVLECGAFIAANPDLDMISIGPTIHDVHSVKEACSIESIDRLWKLIEGILNNIE